MKSPCGDDFAQHENHEKRYRLYPKPQVGMRGGLDKITGVEWFERDNHQE